ncbi:hypothetical protein CYMTET_41774 [Cymbomonas tetramitiformis]|uniref:Uncharacterized protein n=1 Tax=Cymbomonas tetramitiformis TaxID=36881 RepID=A0AAE0C5D9_9CHLO|nr:hypothetical protein CYMTET_41774 [Cymbomonas tetramitiformis]
MAHPIKLYADEKYMDTDAQHHELDETPKVIRNFIEKGNWVTTQFLEHCIRRMRDEAAALEKKVFEAINTVQETVFSSPQAEDNPTKPGLAELHTSSNRCGRNYYTKRSNMHTCTHRSKS